MLIVLLNDETGNQFIYMCIYAKPLTKPKD